MVLLDLGGGGLLEVVLEVVLDRGGGALPEVLLELEVVAAKIRHCWESDFFISALLNGSSRWTWHLVCQPEGR